MTTEVVFKSAMLSLRNSAGLEAKNYNLGLGLVDGLASASSYVASWPHCSLGKHCFTFTFWRVLCTFYEIY